MNYRCWIPGRDETADSAREIDAPTVSVAACRIAERDHAQHGGWEWSWPITYHVQAGEGAPIYTVEVNRETVPEFWAGRPRLA